jgi:hypothetical protein
MTETHGQEVKKEGEEINGRVAGKCSALGSNGGLKLGVRDSDSTR